MLTFLLQIIGGVAQGVASWCTQRANPKNVETRVINAENKQLDAVHEHIKNRDVDAIRRDINS